MSGEAFENPVQRKGFSATLDIGKKDPEGGVFAMMTTFGAELATMVVDDWRHAKRDIKFTVVVTLEDATP